MSDPLARRNDDAPLFMQQPEKPATVKRPIAQTSLAANEHVDRGADYQSILTWLNRRRVEGGTHGEWCDEFERESSTSGRFTELSDADLIAGIDGETRRSNGRRAAQVYRITTRGEAAMRSGIAAIVAAVREGKKRRKAG